jgi:acylphosphatase
MPARRWLISGHVQGVGFRYFVARNARRLGLKGKVRNLPDGTVEVEVAGETDLIEKLKEEVRHGPAGAHVARLLEHEALQQEAWEGFEIDH